MTKISRPNNTFSSSSLQIIQGCFFPLFCPIPGKLLSQFLKRISSPPSTNKGAFSAMFSCLLVIVRRSCVHLRLRGTSPVDFTSSCMPVSEKRFSRSCVHSESCTSISFKNRYKIDIENASRPEFFFWKEWTFFKDRILELWQRIYKALKRPTAAGR